MNKAKKNLITLLIAIASVLLALMIAVTCVMYAFSSYMDQYLGRGTRVVTDTGEGLDGDYINFKYNSKEEALANAQAVPQETAAMLKYSCSRRPRIRRPRSPSPET